MIVRPIEDRLKRQLVEEFHREGIPTIERARAVRQFKDSSRLNNVQVAKVLSITSERVGQLLAMTEDPQVERAIEEGHVEPTKAVAP